MYHLCLKTQNMSKISETKYLNIPQNTKCIITTKLIKMQHLLKQASVLKTELFSTGNAFKNYKTFTYTSAILT